MWTTLLQDAGHFFRVWTRFLHPAMRRCAQREAIFSADERAHTRPDQKRSTALISAEFSFRSSSPASPLVKMVSNAIWAVDASRGGPWTLFGGVDTVVYGCWTLFGGVDNVVSEKWTRCVHHCFQMMYGKLLVPGLVVCVRGADFARASFSS